MLTIVTGLPGAGKTLYTLSKLLPRYRGRKVFTHGIPAIDHAHFGTEELEHPDDWYQLPEGSVVVIDEAQKVFPVRPAGSQVPKKCSEFETHRHRGFDIILLTQDATTLDVHIRKLAGAHLHVHRLFGGQSSNVYEYGNFESKPIDRNTQRRAINVNSWKFDKAVFDHYKSADLHTVKRRFPKRFIWLPVLGLLGCFAIWYLFHAFGQLRDRHGGGAGPDAGVGPARQMRASVERLSFQQQFVPEVEGIPWSAPAYQAAAKIRTFPKPHCIIVEKAASEKATLNSCQCYTQQATRLQGVALEVCADIARNGWFDYTRSDARRDRARSAERGERRGEVVNGSFLGDPSS